ncbi:MAG TPA: hypothetical protein VEG60_16755, partial [Candidatus Binatia bacterium]|nr:hypothetical protein [Candidatus Binatia bacterium]
MKTDPKQFAPAALQRLMRDHWPGNTRQLENEVRGLVASVRGTVINEEHLNPSIRNAQEPVAVTQKAVVSASATQS